MARFPKMIFFSWKTIKRIMKNVKKSLEWIQSYEDTSQLSGQKMAHLLQIWIFSTKALM